MSERVHESIYKCEKLADLIEEDIREISKSLGGEVYDSYTGWVNKERKILDTIRDNLRRFNYQ